MNKKILVLFVILLMSISATQAQTQVGKYVFNNTVYSVVHDASGNIYVGGNFSGVGLYSGNGAKINTSTSAWDTSFVKVNSTINTVVAIPGGGWYIGGGFNEVGGLPRNCLARINADGSLHPFDPNVNFSVNALALDAAGNLYAGGNFTTVGGGTPRNRLCKFDSTGALTGFDPQMSSAVNALAIDAAGNLFAGGSFTSVGPTGSAITRNRLCKFDNAGVLQSFNPNVNSEVNALAIDNSSNLYAGGSFLVVGGSELRSYLCKFDALGTLTTFNPNFNSYIRALAIDASDNLYVGGAFYSVGPSGSSVIRSNLCKFNAAGALASFNPTINNMVTSLALDAAGNLYAGGQFSTVGSIVRNKLCKFDNAGTLTSFDPNMIESVNALALDATGNLYAGGGFYTLGVNKRNRLCKFDATGTLTSFNPDLNDQVSTLAIDASGNLYAGGIFTSVGPTGSAIVRNRLCKFDHTGALSTFNPNMSSHVKALALDASGNLYAGGSFTNVGGIDIRNRLCKFDSTGALTNFNPNMGGDYTQVNALALDTFGNLYAGGSFISVGGSNVRNRLCKFDSTGVLTGFDPNMSSNVNSLALDFSGNLYVGGEFTTIGGSTIRARLCKFDATGALTNFNPNMGGDYTSVNALVTDAVGNLYVGGSFTTVGGSTIGRRLCKFDNTGTLNSFNTNISGSVNTITLEATGALHVGGSFSRPRNYYAIYLFAPVCGSTTFGTINASICLGNSYTFNGIAQTTVGTYYDTLVNAGGCDSIITLNLSLKSTTTSSTNLTICSHELPYTWNGLSFTAAGTQTAHLTNSVGCDSAATLNLSVTPSTVISTTNMTACGSYTWNGNTYTQSGTYISPISGCDIHVLNLTITLELLLSAKVFLLGAYDSIAGKMHDSLRVKGLIPTMEPYSAAPFNKAVISELAGETVSSSVLAITGDNAIVDWVFVELRSSSNSANVVATKRALIQRDGDIVSAVDGISPVPFFTLSNDNYYVSIKHRNHLGIISLNTIPMSSCIPSVIDFTNSANVYTIPSQPTNTNYPARKQIGSTYLMWSGDARNNKNIKYNGLNNDKDFVLTSLGGAGFINSTLNLVYRSEDNNMDGKVRYNNTDNDRVLILSNLGNQSNNIINQHTPN